MQPNSSEITKRKKSLLRKQMHNGMITKLDKKTLILDLDETLIHCN